MNNKNFRVSRRALLPLLFCSATVLAGDGGTDAPYGQLPQEQAALTLESDQVPCDSGNPARGGGCPDVVATAAAPAPDTMQQAKQLGKESDGFVDDATATGAPGLNTSYVGGKTRLGVGIDSEFKGKADLSHVFTETEDTAVIGQGYIGVDPRNGQSTGHVTGAGAQVNYHWASKDESGQVTHVNKVFGAYDQNGTGDKDGKQAKKITAGYGQENEKMFWSGSVSKGVSGKTDTGAKDADGNTVYEKAYDWGVGGRVGTYLADQQMRVQGGVDYEWGTEHAANESKAKQVTATGSVEKFFPDSPHSVNANIDVYKKSGGYQEGEQKTEVRGGVGYRYDLASDSGIWQADKMYRRVRTEIPGEPAQKPAKVERKLVKHTMELESDTFFKVDSAKLTPEAQERLQSVIAQIRASGHEGNIRITGNTCDIGSTAHNQGLSERRAKSVRDFLAKNGFDGKELIAQGLGETSPKYPNTDAERHKNRRVDIEYVAYQNEYKDKVVEQGGTTATDPKVVWKQELIPSPPLWVRQALHNTIEHKQRVDTYKTTAGGDNTAPVCKIQASDNLSESATQNSKNNVLDVFSDDETCDDSAKITAVGTTNHGGTVTISADGSSLQYTPAADFVGEETFTYTITDKNGSSTATVKVTVEGSGCAIEAADNRDEKVDKNSTNNSLNVMDNDTTCGGAEISEVGATSNGGTVKISDDKQTLIYTPVTGYVGTDTFTYTIKDSNGKTSTATVVVVVGTCDTCSSCPTETSKTGSLSYQFRNTAPLDIKTIAVTDYLSAGKTAADIETVYFEGGSSSMGYYATTTSGTKVYAGLLQIQADNTIKFTPSAGTYCKQGTFDFYIKLKDCDTPIKVTMDVTQTS